MSPMAALIVVGPDILESRDAYQDIDGFGRAPLRLLKLLKMSLGTSSF